jgi:Gluconate 2-dehydrogenase subunit 3
MKRRKAIGTILLAGGATVAGLGGYEWYSLVKDPDKKYLLSRKTLLTELAEMIIPATDTPGAREAGAVDYMMNFLTECTDTKTLNRFIYGLRELEDYTHSNYHREFTDCSPTEKELVLQHFEEKSRPTHSLFEKAKNRFTGYPFFMALKTYTVFGYCISEKGASLGMHYIAVPGKYLSCIPLESNQKAWATK